MVKPLLRFRPSSHSTDYTLVSAFNTKKSAEQTKKEIEEMLADPSGPARFWSDVIVKSRGKILLFKAYTNHVPPEEIIDLLATAPNLLKTIQYVNRDFVEITITLPVKASIESAPLLLSSQKSDTLRELLQVCEQEIEPNQKDRIILRYVGDDCALVHSENAMYIGEAVVKLSWKNWQVTLVPPELNQKLCEALKAEVVLERKPLNRRKRIKEVRKHEQTR